MSDFSIRDHIKIFLNQWQKDNAVSDHAFANAVGVSSASVRRWKLGKCIPDIDLLPKVCDFMNVSILDFMGLNETTCLSQKQIQILTKYKNDKAFHNLIDKYISDTEFQSALDTFIKLMK